MIGARARPSRSAICRRPTWASIRSDCIREVDNAYSQEGGLVILYGNLAPKGAVVKAAGVRPEMLKHSGPAVIFEAETEAYEGIVNGKVKAGDVVVIRYEGPRGGPGMQEMLAPTTAIKGMRLDDKVALVTDGRFSGGTAGACIGHVSPEAAAGGPIALLQPGDIIDIDIPGHYAERPAERGRAGRSGEEVEAPPAALHDRLPRQVHRDGHQRRHGRGVEVGLRRESGEPKAESGRTREMDVAQPEGNGCGTAALGCVGALHSRP